MVVESDTVGPDGSVFIFQANPDRWDLVERLPEVGIGGVEDWVASAHRTKMRRGDVVLLWSSKGAKGRERGIYGVARIVGPARKDEDSGDHMVPIVVANILQPPILEPDVQRVPDLRDLSILGGLQGTNFLVAREDWTVLRAAFPALLENIDAPIPTEPVVVSAEKRDELARLLSEFAETYDIVDHAERARISREVGKANYTRAREYGSYDDETGLNLVLRGLMPHPYDADGRWVSIAPAVSGDIRSWFESQSWVEPEQWPGIAQAVIDFLEEALSGKIETACRQFVSRPFKGIQSGILTPILNALDSERFLIVNAKPVEMLNYFAETSVTTELREYPEVNEMLKEFAQLCERVAPDSPKFEDLNASELMDTFSHWLKAEKKYPTTVRKLRHFKISPGREAKFWDECLEQGVISIGWDDLGDLSDLSKSEFEERVALVQQQHPDWTKSALHQVWSVARLREGDKVVANEGTTKVLGFGTVTGPYYYDETAREQRHRLPVEWDDVRPRRVERGGWRRTVIKLDEDEWNELLQAPLLSETGAAPTPNPKISPVEPGAPSDGTNTILFGPPGTGKTWITSRRAVTLCLEPDDERELDPSDIDLEFRALRKKAQVEFVTFHQSYGYEEFVEGIRPVMDSDGAEDVQYRCEDGIFKRIALRAAAEGLPTQTAEAPFDTLWARLLDEIEREEASPHPTITTDPGGREYSLGTTSRGNIRAHYVTHGEGELQVSEKHLMAFRKYGRALWKHRERLPRTLEAYSYQQVSGTIAQELGTQGGCHGNIQWLAHVRMLGYAEAQANTDPTSLDTSSRVALLQELLSEGRTNELNYNGAPQYVLVVDEINRGNISKILGELITLLEPSKRLTKNDELLVQLPYTKELFGVPPNLHIVGTMNTADRSIALMDVALRRRFTFEEMMPDWTIVRDQLARHVSDKVFDGKRDFINLVVALFECINARIRFLYDDDHQLGHAYFLHATTYKALGETIRRNVIPMLREYFYGSWDRVCACLGCPYDEHRPARPELVVDGEYRNAFVTATLVKERDLLGFDHVDFEDDLSFAVNPGWLADEGSPERLKAMCVDVLSGEYRENYEKRRYYP